MKMKNNPLEGDNGWGPGPFNVSPPSPEFHLGGTIDEGQRPREENAVMASIQENLQGLLQGMSELRQDFDTKVKYDESKERIIETLHRELLGHQEGLHFRILKPIFIDLIAMHDDLDKQMEYIAQTNSSFSKEMLPRLKGFQE